MPRRRETEESCCGGDEEEAERERPHQRNAANARERARMRVLARAFCRLKTTLPWVPPDTKLSKLDTLRLATSYIAHLRAVLNHHQPPTTPPDYTPPVHPLNLTWPFSFQHGSSSGTGGGGGGGGGLGDQQCPQPPAQHCQMPQTNYATYSDSLLQIG